MEVLKDTKLCMSVHCLLFFHVHLLKCSAVHSAVFSNDGHTHTPGMGIVKNANFCGNETDFPWRIFVVCVEKKLAVKKRRKNEHRFQFCTAYLRNIWSAFICGCCLSWSCTCEHSHLLLLSRAGNRLERSHSYTLLCYVSAKKKRMLRKF